MRRWDPAEVGAAVHELLAKAPAPAPVYGAQRRASAHPLPADVQAHWRAGGIWTDETLLDRLDAADGAQLAIVDGDERLTIYELRTRTDRGRDRDRGNAGFVPAMWSGGSFRTGGKRSCSAGRSGGAVRSRARSHRRCAHASSRYILEATSARAIAVPAAFRGTDYRALLAEAGFDGDIVLVRGDDPLPASSAPLPAADVSVDDAAAILWTSGTTSDPKGVVHTHQSLRVEAETIAAAHAMPPGETMLLPMPVTHIAGLTYGPLLPVTSGITAVVMDVWDPGPLSNSLNVSRSVR